MQYWDSMLTSKLLIANFNHFDMLPVDPLFLFSMFVWKNKGKFVPQTCNICIFKHLKAISPLHRMERERVFEYTSIDHSPFRQTFELGIFISTAGIKEHPKFSKMVKFG